MDLLLLQQWKTIAALLTRARSRLPTPCEEAREAFENAVAVAMDYLEHNELELALDSLTDAVELAPSRGGVWRDLERAAEAMELHAKTAYLRQKLKNRSAGFTGLAAINSFKPTRIVAPATCLRWLASTAHFGAA